MHNDSNYEGATLAVALNKQIGEYQNEINVLPPECFQGNRKGCPYIAPNLVLTWYQTQCIGHPQIAEWLPQTNDSGLLWIDNFPSVFQLNFCKIKEI